jgi:hypothetical protein
VYKALKLIQRAASMKSWKMQNKTTGKVYAMSEHLLSFDDLFDISLIVWLLAEPGIFQEVVEMFMPYIRGLELTSELEFAFTNVSAFVRHIIDLDFERFMIQARSKSIEAIEVDPLNILNQATF